MKDVKALARLARRRRHCGRMVVGFIGAVLLPGIAFFFLLCARAYADGLPVPYADTVEKLAGQNVAYWFLTLAGITIASWTFIVKWLIAQLEQQRKANVEITQRLISYMEKDHADMRQVMGEVLTTLRTMRPNHE